MKIKLTAPPRGADSYGAGHFHASRGSRVHQGVDLLAAASSGVHALLGGTVTKLGYTYADDLSYRYVEVTDIAGYRLRYYYVKPSVQKGDKIEPDGIIGYVQDLSRRYKEIPNHIHFEIKDPQGSKIRVNPEEYLKSIT
jgi:murein DD-endopeptidase MepM/ murein hydrolase activator NlpD